MPRDVQPSQSACEFRVGIINEGTPFGPLYLPCKDEVHAEHRRKSWASDSEAWIERRVIGPWERLAS